MDNFDDLEELTPETLEILEEYKQELKELTFNCKPIITNLSIIAGENPHIASHITKAVCNHLLEVPVNQKLFTLYLIDSISKNVRGQYIQFFAARLPGIFCKTYEEADESIRVSLKHLFETWKNVFPPGPLRFITNQCFPPKAAINSKPVTSTPSSLPLRSSLASSTPQPPASKALNSSLSSTQSRIPTNGRTITSPAISRPTASDQALSLPREVLSQRNPMINTTTSRPNLLPPSPNLGNGRLLPEVKSKPKPLPQTHYTLDDYGRPQWPKKAIDHTPAPSNNRITSVSNLSKTPDISPSKLNSQTSAVLARKAPVSGGPLSEYDKYPLVPATAQTLPTSKVGVKHTLSTVRPEIRQTIQPNKIPGAKMVPRGDAITSGSPGLAPSMSKPVAGISASRPILMNKKPTDAQAAAKRNSLIESKDGMKTNAAPNAPRVAPVIGVKRTLQAVAANQNQKQGPNIDKLVQTNQAIPNKKLYKPIGLVETSPPKSFSSFTQTSAQALEQSSMLEAETKPNIDLLKIKLFQKAQRMATHDPVLKNKIISALIKNEDSLVMESKPSLQSLNPKSLNEDSYAIPKFSTAVPQTEETNSKKLESPAVLQSSVAALESLPSHSYPNKVLTAVKQECIELGSDISNEKDSIETTVDESSSDPFRTLTQQVEALDSTKLNLSLISSLPSLESASSLSYLKSLLSSTSSTPQDTAKSLDTSHLVTTSPDSHSSKAISSSDSTMFNGLCSTIPPEQLLQSKSPHTDSAVLPDVSAVLKDSPVNLATPEEKGSDSEPKQRDNNESSMHHDESPENIPSSPNGIPLNSPENSITNPSVSDEEKPMTIDNKPSLASLSSTVHENEEINGFIDPSRENHPEIVPDEHFLNTKPESSPRLTSDSHDSQSDLKNPLSVPSLDASNPEPISKEYQESEHLQDTDAVHEYTTEGTNEKHTAHIDMDDDDIELIQQEIPPDTIDDEFHANDVDQGNANVDTDGGGNEMNLDEDHEINALDFENDDDDDTVKDVDPHFDVEGNVYEAGYEHNYDEDVGNDNALADHGGDFDGYPETSTYETTNESEQFDYAQDNPFHTTVKGSNNVSVSESEDHHHEPIEVSESFNAIPQNSNEKTKRRREMALKRGEKGVQTLKGGENRENFDSLDYNIPESSPSKKRSVGRGQEKPSRIPGESNRPKSTLGRGADPSRGKAAARGRGRGRAAAARALNRGWIEETSPAARKRYVWMRNERMSKAEEAALEYEKSEYAKGDYGASMIHPRGFARGEYSGSAYAMGEFERGEHLRGEYARRELEGGYGDDAMMYAAEYDYDGRRAARTSVEHEPKLADYKGSWSGELGSGDYLSMREYYRERESDINMSRKGMKEREDLIRRFGHPDTRYLEDEEYREYENAYQMQRAKRKMIGAGGLGKVGLKEGYEAANEDFRRRIMQSMAASATLPGGRLMQMAEEDEIPISSIRANLTLPGVGSVVAKTPTESSLTFPQNYQPVDSKDYISKRHISKSLHDQVQAAQSEFMPIPGEFSMKQGSQVLSPTLPSASDIQALHDIMVSNKQPKTLSDIQTSQFRQEPNAHSPRLSSSPASYYAEPVASPGSRNSISSLLSSLLAQGVIGKAPSNLLSSEPIKSDVTSLASSLSASSAYAYSQDAYSLNASTHLGGVTHQMKALRSLASHPALQGTSQQLVQSYLTSNNLSSASRLPLTSSAPSGLYLMPRLCVFPELAIGLEFRSDVLKIPHMALIDQLYSDGFIRQCDRCGLRFRDQDEYGRHLDMHFQKRKRQRQQKVTTTRNWYVRARDWLTGVGLSLTEAPASGSSVMDRSQMEADLENCAVPSDDSQPECILCGEKFEEYFNKEEDEWMFKGAIYWDVMTTDDRKVQKIIHAKCKPENPSLSITLMDDDLGVKPTTTNSTITFVNS